MLLIFLSVFLGIACTTVALETSSLYEASLQDSSIKQFPQESVVIASYQGDLQNLENFLLQAQRDEHYDIDKEVGTWRGGAPLNPLMAAVLMGNDTVVSFLLSQGANPSKSVLTRDVHYISNPEPKLRPFPPFWSKWTKPFLDVTGMGENPIYRALDVARYAVQLAPEADKQRYQTIVHLLQKPPSQAQKHSEKQALSLEQGLANLTHTLEFLYEDLA